MQKPVLNKRIFWDVNFDSIDYDDKYGFVIERVFERGDVCDIREVRRYYNDEKIKKVLIEAKYLPEIKMYLASAIFDILPVNFRCYTQTQSMKELWPY